ncbi:MAG: hypothetical protein HYU65_00415 [Armatimonadetes bacterium]|nr:hypothetical protein [Armatimonadota bacterium]
MSTISLEQEFVRMLPPYDRLLARMARGMWALSILMGLTIVIAAFFIGLSNSGLVAQYFSNPKAVREAAAAGSAIVDQKVVIESVFAWLPGFKFFGMGLLFSGITFVLANIINALRAAGGGLQKALGVEVKAMAKPLTAKLFPPLMMMGLMILIATFVIGLWLAGFSAGYWNHSIATELDAAQVGSPLLAQIATIQSVKAWLEPVKFVGIAFLLTGISLALATIRKILQFQAGRILDIVPGTGR